MGNINDLKNALLHSSTDVLIEGIGVFKRSHKSAVLSSDGRTLVPPQMGWNFCAGVPEVLPNRVERVLIDGAELNSLQQGIELGSSFEIATLGFFYKMQGCYEFMPFDKELLLANQHFGLHAVHLNQRAQATHVAQLPVNIPAKPKSDIAFLKVAAMILAILSVMTISSQLFYDASWYEHKGLALLNIFDENPESKPESTSVEEVIFGITKFSDSITRFEETNTQSFNLVDTQLEIQMQPSIAVEPLQEVRPLKFYENPFAAVWEATGPKAIQRQADATENSRSQVDLAKEENVVPPAQANEADNTSSRQVEAIDRTVAQDGAVIQNELKVAPAQEAAERIYVVVGAFAEQGNANKLKVKLQQQGYVVSPTHSIQVGKLHRVVLQAPAGAVEADFISSIKNSVNPAAWVLAK